MKERLHDMKSLDPNIYEALTESSRRRHEVLNKKTNKSNIPELLMLRQLQEEWDQNNDDLIAA